MDHDDDYSSEFTQWIKIELYQRKSQMSDLAIHVKQGEMVFSLRSIYRTPVFRTTNDIETGGTMTVRSAKHTNDHVVPLSESDTPLCLRQQLSRLLAGSPKVCAPSIPGDLVFCAGRAGANLPPSPSY